MNPSRRALIAAAPALFLPAAAHALTAPEQAMVDRAIGYLQSLTSARGRFVQTDARGSQTQGALFLQRPGRARFEYDAPSSLLVVSDGRVVSVADKRLKTVNRYFLSQTPLKLFLADEIRFDRGVRIDRVTPLADGFEIQAHDRTGRTRGQLALTFGDDPLRLIGWRIVDARGATTQVRLTSLVRASGLDPALFKAPFPQTATRRAL